MSLFVCIGTPVLNCSANLLGLLLLKRLVRLQATLLGIKQGMAGQHSKTTLMPLTFHYYIIAGAWNLSKLNWHN